MLRAIGDVWRARARDIGDFQSRFLLTVFYFTVLAPFGLVTRFSRDPLRLRRRRTSATAWTARPAGDTTLEGIRRQF